MCLFLLCHLWLELLKIQTRNAMVNFENSASQTQVTLCLHDPCSLILVMDSVPGPCSSKALSLSLSPSLHPPHSKIEMTNSSIDHRCQMNPFAHFIIRDQLPQNLQWRLPVSSVLFMLSIGVCVCVRVKVTGLMLLHST